MAPRLHFTHFNQPLTINSIATDTRACHENPHIRMIAPLPSVRSDSVLFWDSQVRDFSALFRLFHEVRPELFRGYYQGSLRVLSAIINIFINLRNK